MPMMKFREAGDLGKILKLKLLNIKTILEKYDLLRLNNYLFLI